MKRRTGGACTPNIIPTPRPSRRCCQRKRGTRSGVPLGVGVGLPEESNHLFTASKTDPETERNKLATQVGETFEELATLTRRLSTALPVIAPDEPVAQSKPREHFWQLCRPRKT